MCYNPPMHVKGIRFGFPLVKRFGIIKHHETYTVTWNRHPGPEIHYVLKGDIAWELRGREAPLAVSGGSFGIIPANVRHRAIDNKGTPAVRLGAILECPLPERADGTPFTAEDLRRIFRQFGEHGGASRRFTSRLRATLRELTDALSIENATRPDGQLRLRMLATSLIYETFAACGEPESLSKGVDVIPQIRKWIDAHLAEEIALPRLVKLSGYGRSRFFDLFFADTGLTPNDYLVRARINRAKQELARPAFGGTLLGLAARCGFKSATVFSATFRRHVGVSPSRFRAEALS